MEYLDFNLAKKLKEKGFPQHWSDQHYILENEYDDFFEVGAKYPVDVIYDYISTIAAPTISQVLKWLRERKKIHISPVLWGMGWYVDIQSFTKETDEDYVYYDVDNKFQSIDYETYEEAVIAGVNYCLENLI